MRYSLNLCCLWLGACQVAGGPVDEADQGGPHPFDRVRQRSYVCHRAAEPPVIDGRLDEAAWRAAQATEAFVDIRGDSLPKPRFETHARMLWDDEHFYIGAELEEPELWATLTARDAVIFYDNDFEVFIDPDGDTHHYFELEINALGTEWDLLLLKPYRDGGPAVNAWDMPGLRSAVHLDGTLNDPSDVDRGWSVEIAIPWEALREAAGRPAPPADGDLWWVDFSRVEWRTRVEGGRHVKATDPATGEHLPEDNWVWSPQGVIAMHRPETWGLVMFSGAAAGGGAVEFRPPAELDARLALRRVYEAQREFRESHGRYAPDVASLGLAPRDLAGWSWPPRIRVTESLYEAVLEGEGGGALHLTQDGRLWADGG